jgi:hypothetical protein
LRELMFPSPCKRSNWRCSHSPSWLATTALTLSQN